MRKTLLLCAAVSALCVGVVALTFARAAVEPADFTFVNGAEPKTLDPHTMTGQPDGRIALALFEGLTYLDPKTLLPVPGVAERWDVEDDGLLWTFHLRHNARWSNGDTVTAKDFYWSWKRLLAPETASEYSYMLWDVVNAEKFTKGEVKDFSQVGIELLDDWTIRIRLKAYVPYFLDLISFYTLCPVHPATVGKWDKIAPGRWTLPGNIVTNGPFLLESWVVNDRIRLRKNPKYWDADSIKLETIDAFSMDDATAQLNVYLRGEAQWNPGYWPASLNREILKLPDFTRTEAFIVYYYRINNTLPQFKDRRVRQALSLAIDRTEIVKNVLGLGETEAFNYVPPGVAGYVPPEGLGYHPDRARQLLAEAGYPGGKGFPKTNILYNTFEVHRQVATVVARQLSKNLGIEVQPFNEEWQAYQQHTRTLEYDLARAGWIADYRDPITFLDMWITDGGNNQTGYSNPLYDRLYRIAKDTLAFVAAPDEEIYGKLVEGGTLKALVEATRALPAGSPERLASLSKVRMLVLKEMDRLVSEIDVPILPVYFYVTKTLLKPEIGGCYLYLDRGDGKKIPNVLDMHPLRGFFRKDR
ncbi:MAG TPA: peptide ABC transporter substrate-binding protein [Planctomycetota bacterium]|nr:peptide ABC transporter substrate-binding protein [Planctomycetota bacterium]